MFPDGMVMGAYASQSGHHSHPQKSGASRRVQTPYAVIDLEQKQSVYRQTVYFSVLAQPLVGCVVLNQSPAFPKTYV